MNIKVVVLEHKSISTKGVNIYKDMPYSAKAAVA